MRISSRGRAARARAAPVLSALLLGGLALALWAPRARAVILPAVTIDGPSQDIVGFGGVAMAEDGGGGLVYLKRVEGVAHVFVSRFAGGEWQAPIRVDRAQPFAASWARIGAAEGGELVVVWATPVASEGSRPVDELVGATLGPGAPAFGPAKVVDPDIRSGAGASPDLAMSSTGAADVVYRVLTETPGQPSPIPLLRPGDVVEEVRVAHYEGETWTQLGAINRDGTVSMRPPAQANAPQIAIGPTGNGVVVWQEPERTGVARIWARRIFGRSLDYVLPVSATTFSGKPINDDADAPAVTVSPAGEAEVAYRQEAEPGSPLQGPRIFMNTLPDGEAADGTQFAGARVADEAVGRGYAATVGPPAIDADAKNEVRLVYDADGTPHVVEGGELGLAGTLTLGPRFAGTELSAASVMDPAGGGVSAWPSADASGPGVAVREDFAGGGLQTALVRGGIGGPVEGLAVARSGLGDGLLGVLQGPLGEAAVVADLITAPPAPFLVSAPSGWVTPERAVVSWSAPLSINAPVQYAVVRDGRVLAVPRGATRLRLDPRGLGSGAHLVQVLATDAFGDATLTRPRTLKVDAQPPAVTFRQARRGRTVTVSVSDRFSGVNRRSLTITFGDGTRVRGRAVVRHRYARAGIYTIVVRAASRAGNRGVARHAVEVA